MAKTVFYARVSTRDQNPALQVDAARKMGVKNDDIFVEKASGGRGDRPVLAQALAACQKGDTLACWKLDRVGRSVKHLSNLLADLEARGVHFRTVEDGLNTQGSTGKLVLHMLECRRSVRARSDYRADQGRPGDGPQERQAPRTPGQMAARYGEASASSFGQGRSHGARGGQRAEGLEAHTLLRSARRSRARRAFRGLKLMFLLNGTHIELLGG